MIVLLIHGDVVGLSREYDGKYLEAFDPDANEGYGRLEATTEIDKAMKFKSPAEALEFWRTPSTVMPWRDDGQPNRPLTSFTVELVDPERKRG